MRCFVISSSFPLFCRRDLNRNLVGLLLLSSIEEWDSPCLLLVEALLLLVAELVIPEEETVVADQSLVPAAPQRHRHSVSCTRHLVHGCEEIRRTQKILSHLPAPMPSIQVREDTRRLISLLTGLAFLLRINVGSEIISTNNWYGAPTTNPWP